MRIAKILRNLHFKTAQLSAWFRYYFRGWEKCSFSTSSRPANIPKVGDICLFPLGIFKTQEVVFEETAPDTWLPGEYGRYIFRFCDREGYLIVWNDTIYKKIGRYE